MEEEEVKKATLQLVVERKCEECTIMWLYRDGAEFMWFSSRSTAWNAQRAVAETLLMEGYIVEILEEKDESDGTID